MRLAGFRRYRVTDLAPMEHCICDQCYAQQFPGRIPARVSPRIVRVNGTVATVEPRLQNVCCWCESLTRSGIFLFLDPAGLRCEGIHFPGH